MDFIDLTLNTLYLLTRGVTRCWLMHKKASDFGVVHARYVFDACISADGLDEPEKQTITYSQDNLVVV